MLRGGSSASIVGAASGCGRCCGCTCNRGPSTEFAERLVTHTRYICIRIGKVDTADADRIFSHARPPRGRLRPKVLERCRRRNHNAWKQRFRGHCMGHGCIRGPATACATQTGSRLTALGTSRRAAKHAGDGKGSDALRTSRGLLSKASAAGLIPTWIQVER